ncbi:serine palmitoyltransferase [Arenibaculum sp.]|uniref:serine palmitoyltransferase n=1 Tax=Arenibaculum sp. TaxID=2865862 RepID=UPI002E12BE8D|nr:aminotransferase class I/II-fold pyridoxal phosphate-dependent enzyme [Arenibaculum sp.]
MLDLSGRLAALVEGRRHLVAEGANPFGVCLDRVISPTEAIVDGRPILLAGTNNYLGLSFARECVEAAREAAATSGTGTTGSRVANGTHALHRRLERRLAELFDVAGAIVFSTGYLANLGVFSALLGPGDTVLIDADAHACIYDGCRLSGATMVRFRHNDCADLDRRLTRLSRSSPPGLVVIAVEGIYSMLGDCAPLPGIVEVKRRHGAVLVVDEAHSFGVLGAKGRGLADATGCGDEADFIVGTFSKSVGTTGGFCVSSRPGLDLLRYSSRPYVFSASPAPPIAAAALAALDLIDEGEDLRRRLWDNAARLHAGLAALGLDLAAPPGPIVAVRMPDEETLAACWRGLLERGVYVNLALPPGTPHGTYLLRCSVSAAHTPDQIDRICRSFAEVARG